MKCYTFYLASRKFSQDFDFAGLTCGYDTDLYFKAPSFFTDISTYQILKKMIAKII